MRTLNICHLYGDLMNTYSDIGNILVFKYLAQKLNIDVNVDLISIDDYFDENKYDFVLFGGGQDYEQSIISKDLSKKAPNLQKYIENNGVFLAICGGFQLLGQYYIDATGKKIEGAHILPHYTEQPKPGEERFIGDIQIQNEEFGDTYVGFENHSGRTYLQGDEKPLGKVIKGFGNNGKDHGEGVIYKNTFGSYFHGPILARNPKLAGRLLNLALINRYGNETELLNLANAN